MIDSMRDVRLDDFLAGVRGLVESGDGSDVVVLGEALLADATPGALATARARLGSAVRILDRRGEDVSDLVGLGERFTQRLLEAVAGESQRDEREYSHSLGTRIVNELKGGPLSPTVLSGRLGVEISQISRAARALRDDGRMVVERDPDDGRRRVYKTSNAGAGRVKRWGWRVFVERLPALRACDVASDLLPHRAGDDSDRAAMARICDAFAEDLSEGRYQPARVYETDVPKPAGGQRPAAALRLADRLAYAALVERCRAEVEACLVSDRAVLWPRGLRGGKKWDEFERFVAASGASHVLSVDVQSFYDSIRHDILGDALTRAGCDAEVVAVLTGWLGGVMGRRWGLPQGLEASDPLASVVLSRLDRALADRGVRYARHGDDLRVVGTHAEVSDAQRLVRDELRELGLVMNDDKTRVLRHSTYTQRRREITRGVRQYLAARKEDINARNSAIFRLLEALGDDDELSWSWYHGNLNVSQVLQAVGSFEAADTRALMILLKEAETSEQQNEHILRSFRPDPRAVVTPAVMTPGVVTPAAPAAVTPAAAALGVRAGLSLLAAEGEAAPEIDLDASVVARHEYADVLSAYVEQAAPSRPVQIAGLLQRIEATGVTYDAQWLRLYKAIDGAVSADFDALAEGHLNPRDPRHNYSDRWIRRIPAARFMARRDRLDSEHLHELHENAPPALRDDILGVIAESPQRSSRSLLREKLRKEGKVVAALLHAQT